MEFSLLRALSASSLSSANQIKDPDGQNQMNVEYSQSGDETFQRLKLNYDLDLDLSG